MVRIVLTLHCLSILAFVKSNFQAMVYNQDSMLALRLPVPFFVILVDIVPRGVSITTFRPWNPLLTTNSDVWYSAPAIVRI